MIDYKSIIRLKSADYSNTRVGASIGCSRNTVAEVWKLAQDHKHKLTWPIDSSLTNEDIQQILYPDQTPSGKRMEPDFEQIYQDLAKPGVTLTLLWSEYCVKCADAGKIPY